MTCKDCGAESAIAEAPTCACAWFAANLNLNDRKFLRSIGIKAD